MWTPLTQQGVEALGLAVSQCLQRWTALQLAVHNEWGGPNSATKCQQFHIDILAFFIRSKEQRYIDELEDLLDQCMLDYFNTDIEDGSLFEVADQMMTIHEQCMLENFENARRMAIPASGSGQSMLDSKQFKGSEQAKWQEERDRPDKSQQEYQPVLLSSPDENGSTIGSDPAELANDSVNSLSEDDSFQTSLPASSSAAPAVTDVSGLTEEEEETSDGWQSVTSRRTRCGKS